MKEIRLKVNNFLKKYNIHHSAVDMKRNCDEFIKEMKAGLEGKDSSLKMLQTYISTNGDYALKKPVIAIDAGGTNLSIALVRFEKNNQAKISDLQSHSMPGSKSKIDKDEFFEIIVKYLKPVINYSNTIGFCFSYPVNILPNRDGRLIRFNKEIKVKDMEGVKIGSALLEKMAKNGIKGKKKVVMLNDTTASLLAGKYVYPERKFDSYIGFILGTGTNTCYIEKNRNIKKDSSLQIKPGSTLVNIESGGYSKAPRGDIDIEFNKNTNNPGEQVFEKMISGAYLGGLTLMILKKAAREGLFSSNFIKRINNLNVISTKDINEFCNYPFSDNPIADCIGTMGMMNIKKVKDDRLTLYHIIEGITDRVAKLVTLNLGAVILKTGKGTNPHLPICIGVEGTTFFKLKSLRKKIEYYVRKYLFDEAELYCEFVEPENATIIGAAIAGLTN